MYPLQASGLGLTWTRGDWFRFHDSEVSPPGFSDKPGPRPYVLIEDLRAGAVSAVVLPSTTKRGAGIPVAPHQRCSVDCMIRRPSRIVPIRARSVPVELLLLRYTCHEPDSGVVLRLPVVRP